MTNQPSSHIESVVMRRVRTVHALRTITAPLVGSALIFLLALWGVGREVWVARVFQNMPAPTPAHFLAFAQFFSEAFLNTRFTVQVLLVLAFGGAIWLAYSFVQLLRSHVQMRFQ